MKTRSEHQLANVHSICPKAALTATNNRISNQNLSETNQNHARSFENSRRELYFGTPGDVFQL